jgi:hypothetical protein
MVVMRLRARASVRTHPHVRVYRAFELGLECSTNMKIWRMKRSAGLPTIVLEMFSSTEPGSSFSESSDALHNSEQICLRYDRKTDKFNPFRVWKDGASAICMRVNAEELRVSQLPP